MQQSFWDAYHTGPTLKVMHPITEQPTTLNRALMNSARNEVPAMFDGVAPPYSSRVRDTAPLVAQSTLCSPR